MHLVIIFDTFLVSVLICIEVIN